MIARAALVLALAVAGCASFHAGRLPGAPPDATFAEVDGVHLHYRAVGSGPELAGGFVDKPSPTGSSPDGPPTRYAHAVVMLHGYGASMELWRPVQDALAAHHRVIAVDLKGFGWSSRPAGDYSPAAEAALVWHLLDQLGVDQVSIVGHSWGSSVSLAMVLAQPNRVRRIALYAAYVFDEQLPSFFRWAQVGGIGEVIFSLHYRANAEDRIGLAYHDPRFITQARVDRVLAELDRPGTTAAALAAARGQHFRAMSQRYRDIAQPTLLLWGDDDRVTPLRFGQRLASIMPNATLTVYPACGHIPMVEARTATTRDLLAFLDGDRAPIAAEPPAVASPPPAVEVTP